MDPNLTPGRAQAHHRELVAMAQAGHAARRARRTGRAGVPTPAGWRVTLGRVLLAGGLRLGLPPQRRATARCQARALLADDDLAFWDC